jgi:hypothetical protein
MRPKSAARYRLSASVPVNLVNMRHELAALRDAVPAGSLLFQMAKVAHDAVSLALIEIEDDRREGKA